MNVRVVPTCTAIVKSVASRTKYSIECLENCATVSWRNSVVFSEDCNYNRSRFHTNCSFYSSSFRAQDSAFYPGT